MTEKLLYLLEELKNNYSETLKTDVLNCFKNELSENDLAELNKNRERTENAFAGQHKSFYDEIAFEFVEDLNEFSEMYFLFWEAILYYFNFETKTEFYNSAIELSHDSDATDYINGFLELEKGNSEIALFHFNRIDDYVAYYFIAYCYLLNENFENSIKNNELFLEILEETIEQNQSKDINLSIQTGFLVAKWNVYQDLGYAHNRIEEYQKAIEQYEKAIEIFNLEETYTISSEIHIDENLNDFSIFINNYLFALEKTNQLIKCKEVLEFTVSKIPSNAFYKDKLFKINQKINNSSEVNDLFKRLYRSKKPFNLNSFEETKLISKEKSLEDLIVEQIKNGYKVFNKSLEIYQDEIIFGRQYYIQEVNGILDLLLIDKTNNQLYVVELKRNDAGIEVVNQIENYIKGLQNQLDKEIKGIICLHKAKPELIELVKTKSNIELYSYHFDFNQL